VKPCTADFPTWEMEEVELDQSSAKVSNPRNIQSQVKQCNQSFTKVVEADAVVEVGSKKSKYPEGNKNQGKETTDSYPVSSFHDFCARIEETLFTAQRNSQLAIHSNGTTIKGRSP